MSNRDEFTQKTKDAVAARAGWHCSFEGCGRATVGPSDESSEAVAMVGQAAHISGAASGPGSRRYDASLTPGQRKHIDNAIWLCAMHAIAIDRDAVRYSITELQRMKLAHEALRSKAIVKGGDSSLGTGLLAVGPQVICMGDIAAISAENWKLRLKHFVAGDAHKLIAFINDFPKTAAQDRYVLSNELGDGRLLSAPPILNKETDSYVVTCPVERGFPRIDAQKLESSYAMHPVSNDMYVENGTFARVAGLKALPQYVRSSLSMQRNENVFAPSAGMQFFEYLEEYRGSPWLNWLLTLDVVRQASIPEPNFGSALQRTPLQCVSRVRSFEILSDTPLDGQLPVRVDFEVQGVGQWQHEFTVHMPTPEKMEERALMLAERPHLAPAVRTPPPRSKL